MSYYGKIDTVIDRTAATPDTFGFDDDQELEDFTETNLEQASSEIDRYCNRTFRLVEGETEEIHGNNTKKLGLRNYPVVSINSITVEEDGEELDEGEDFEIVGTKNFDGENQGILKRLGRREYWNEYSTYHIDYDWGYEDDDYPQMLDNVAEELVINRFNEAAAEREASGLENVSMDGYSVSYAIVDAERKGEITESQLMRLKALRMPGWA